jgi:hypothetical protein
MCILLNIIKILYLVNYWMIMCILLKYNIHYSIWISALNKGYIDDLHAYPKGHSPTY